jgi:hypothetical protein
MKINKWTLGLAAVGLVSLAPAMLAQTAAQQGTPLLTSLSATTISGYVDTSAVWNPGTGTANPAPYAFNGINQDGFNLDAVDIKLSKPIEEGKWSAGYVAELNYGADAAGIDGPGVAPLRQGYVDLGVPVGNGLELKMGRWDSLLGYESSDTMNNPNWSYSYGKTFEPTENTGLLASYKFADWIGVLVGAADTLTTGSTIGVDGRTASPTRPVETKKTVVSLLTLTAPDSWGFLKGSALYAGFDHGQGGAEPGVPGFGPTSTHDTTEWYVGTTLNTPLKDLTLGASWDSIEHVDIGGFDAGSFNSIAGYLSYKLTDKATINGRAEYANGSALSVAETGFGPGTVTLPYGTLEKVFALTGTFQYDLWANVISRIEVRWDHNAGGTQSGTFGGYNPGAPSRGNAVMIAANVIYKF